MKNLRLLDSKGGSAMLRKTALFFIACLFITSSSIAQENTTFEKTSDLKRHLLTFFMVGGVPDNGDPSHPVKVLINEAYAVGYSEERQNPIWSAYHVDKVSNNPIHDRPMKFHTDTRTVAQVSGDLTFRRTGEPLYDRGHMTPNNAIQQEWGDALLKWKLF
jgi:DNA/RNA endonuclease G (NUC1)